MKKNPEIKSFSYSFHMDNFVIYQKTRFSRSKGYMVRKIRCVQLLKKK